MIISSISISHKSPIRGDTQVSKHFISEQIGIRVVLSLFGLGSLSFAEFYNLKYMLRISHIKDIFLSRSHSV